MAGRPADASKGDPAGLSVATVFQDPLTRQWAADLWDRVGQVINYGTVALRFWNLNKLTEAEAFAQAVTAAAEADVVVVSIRAEGDLPLPLHVWIDAWLSRRAGRPGALAALIGVPSQPHAQNEQAHSYLAAVARRAGLDFLPREFRLPQVPLVRSNPPGIAAAIQLAGTGPVGGPCATATARMSPA